MSAKLYLIPTIIAEESISSVIPSRVQEITLGLRFFIAEDIRTTRRYLKKIHQEVDIDAIHFFTLNKHTSAEEIATFLEPLEQGNDMGLISEAGVPCIADPGAVIVNMAHEKGIQVVPLVGPSSILMAVMASGLNGQSFAFHGYLPVKQPERSRRIKDLEKRSSMENQSQVFMETPFRNMNLLEDILKNCNDHTSLCIASDISGENEMIATKSVWQWKKHLPDLNKKPAIFVLQLKK